jgi:hypothetical protein
MENKKTDNKASFKPSFKPKENKILVPGQFPTDHQGRITNNKCQGYDASEYSWEKLFKKTLEERVKASTEISKYNQVMKMYYGENWRSLKGKNSVSNVPVKVNKQTLMFELI